jgi:branched-chain amino acid transport system substrate-binding protein
VAAAEKGDIIIGAAIGKTGIFEPFDVPPLNAAKLAIADINAKGGINGRKLKLIEADTRSDPNQGPNAANEVLEKGAEFLLVSCDYDFGAPAARVAQAKGVVVFSLCAGSPKFGVQGIGNMAYTMGAPAPPEAYILAEFAYNDQKYKSAYLLLDDVIDFDVQACKNFKKRFTELGGTIVGEDKFKNGDPSISSQITRFKKVADKADMLMLCSLNPGGGTAVRQIRAAGLKTPIVTTDGMDGDYWLKAVPNLSDFYYAALVSIFGDDPDAKVNEFMDRYEKEFGGRPKLALVITGYSIIEALTKAVEQAGGTKGADVAAKLDAFKDEPLLIGPTSFSKDVHIATSRPMAIIEVADGKPKFLKDLAPQGEAKLFE